MSVTEFSTVGNLVLELADGNDIMFTWPTCRFVVDGRSVVYSKQNKTKIVYVYGRGVYGEKVLQSFFFS